MKVPDLPRSLRLSLIAVLVLAVPGGVRGQEEPVAALPGAGRAIDLATTAERRARLAARVQPAVVLVPAARRRELERDYLQDNDFRQHNTFFYLTEIEAPEAWLLIAADRGGGQRAALFLPRRNPAAERWTGLAIGPGDEASVLTGLPTLDLERLDSALSAERRRGHSTLWVPLDHTTRDDRRVTALLFESAFDVRNLRPVVDSLRLVKDARELERLRRAVGITVEGHLAAAAALQPGIWEYELEATIEGTFRRLGADRLGFPSIVGSGPNSAVLHYDVNRRRIDDGDVVVIDIGAEWGQYTADITRTLPAAGRFTPRQRALYELVLGAQTAAIDSVRPGVTVARLERIAREYLRRHSGTLCGSSTCDRFFVHGLSHWLGMDVHDVGPRNVPLAPGMVLTIEPGVYLPDEGVGIRIEDDVLVTERGHEVLSAQAPRRVDEIERLMRGDQRRK
jgi:Xaa-Pro aminopeptidase